MEVTTEPHSSKSLQRAHFMLFCLAERQHYRIVEEIRSVPIPIQRLSAVNGTAEELGPVGMRSSRRYKQLAHMVMHMKPSVLLRLSSWSRSLRCSLAGLVSSCTQSGRLALVMRTALPEQTNVHAPKLEFFLVGSP